MNRKTSDRHFWTHAVNTPKVNTWRGLAFERVCLEHIENIKRGLGVDGVITNVHSWQCAPDQSKGITGAQVDLLLCRDDRVINICEMKYSEREYIVTKKDADSMRDKINDFRSVTATKHALHPILVTPYGMKVNEYSGVFQRVVTAEHLFL